MLPQLNLRVKAEIAAEIQHMRCAVIVPATLCTWEERLPSNHRNTFALYAIGGPSVVLQDNCI